MSEYREQLLEQMRQQSAQRRDRRVHKLAEDRRIELESDKYNYFGREGGGAPRRDEFGHVITDRKFLPPGSHPPKHQTVLSDPRPFQVSTGALLR